MYESSLFSIYLCQYIYCLGFRKKYWDNFTRIMSTLNALQCVSMTIYNVYLYYTQDNVFPLEHLYYFPDTYSTKSLMYFCSYLYIDGIFEFLNGIVSQSFSYMTMLSLLHHFIGGYGIYLIASTRLGFFIGLYFAMTEFSTIFLNLSWCFRKRSFFLLFYITFIACRIVTIPFLLLYVKNNYFYLTFLPKYQVNMVYYGSFALISLNLFWYILMTRKIIKECINYNKKIEY